MSTRNNTSAAIPAPAVYEGSQVVWGHFAYVHEPIAYKRYNSDETYQSKGILTYDLGEAGDPRCTALSNRLCDVFHRAIERGTLCENDVVRVFRKKSGKSFERNGENIDTYVWRIVNQTTGEVLLDYPAAN